MRLLHRTIAIGITVLLATSTAGAQGTAPGAPIGAADPRIDSVFRAYGPEGPGCAVGIYRDGQLAWARGYGLASVEHGVPIGPRTVFDLGSTSKQFTAALALMLAAEGKLGLDDPVRRHVPELPGWGDSVTVRQLMHHTAGVRDYLQLMSLGGSVPEDFTTQADAVRAVARQRGLDFAPGSDWSYSNSGYLLLAEIVARREGKTFAQVARERIFEPLGMASSLVLDSHVRLVPRKAGSYAPAPWGGYRLETSDYEQVGDGAVQTSLEELARWVANFERPTVGGAALVRGLETQARLTSGKVLPYAGGLEVDSLRGVRRVRHGGAWVGFRADLVRLPERRLAMAALCNRADANPSMLLDRVANLLLDDAGVPRDAGGARAGGPGGFIAAPAWKPVPGIARLAGSYASPTTGRTLRLLVRGDTLLATMGAQTRPLVQDGDHWIVSGAPLHVAFPGLGAADTARTLVLTPLGNGAPDRMERHEPVERVDAPTRESLTGRWYSAELDVTWTIAADAEGRLTMTRPRQPPIPVQPVTDDLLTARGLVLRLERDAARRVRAFTVRAGRAKGMRFERAGA